MKKPSQLIGLDVFSGAGGLSLGAEMAGIDVKYAVEVWESAAATFKRNHPNAIVYNKDIKSVDPSKEIIQNDEHVSVIM